MADAKLSPEQQKVIDDANKRAERAAANKAKRDAAREAIQGETKADAFKRIAVRRTNSVLEAMATLEGVFDRNNYEYTDEAAAKIVGALADGLEKVKARSTGAGKTKTGFVM